jgi:hypothetical protein
MWKMCTNALIWHGKSKNQRQQWVNVTMADNNLQTNYAYDNYGRLIAIRAGTSTNQTSIHQLGFSFNSQKQLQYRTQGTLKEDFTYHGNRLETSKLNGVTTFVTSYDAKGNINSTTQASNYKYNVPEKPYAVGEIENPVWELPGLNIESSYTIDNLIKSISNGTYAQAFAYGPSGQRFQVDQKKNGTITDSKIYVGNSEFYLDAEGYLTRSLTHIYAPTGICAVYGKVGNEGNFHYIHTDYLGSWLAITSDQGSLTKRQSFDAWGRPRNPDTWELFTG